MKVTPTNKKHDEMTMQDSCCMKCAYARIFYFANNIKGVSGNAKIVVCCEDSMEAEFCGDKPKVYCEDSKKSTRTIKW